MDRIDNLSPTLLWQYFSDICKIPRLSKHEGEIRSWLRKFAADKNLWFKEDETGNILIVREPSPGMENRKTVVIQSHLDMVGEKNSDHPHNWFKDPIVTLISDGWVTADGTTLGADDGIGIAAQLAILSDPDIRTGKIECLFTVDEETGMTGAKNLSEDFISGKILINLDSEDEGILFIGCAGGTDSIGTIDYKPGKLPAERVSLKISLTGLAGGHSGDEIHKGFANAIKQMARLLFNLSREYDLLLGTFNGGNLRNGIPRESVAIISVKPDDVAEIRKSVEAFLEILKDEYGPLEPALVLEVSDEEYIGTVMSSHDSDRLINMLYTCPHGVLAWSKDMDDLVETSTNLAVLCFKDGNKVEIVTTQRSSIESGKKYAAGMIEACMTLAGAKVAHSEGYPGWKPNINSEILNITRKSYNELFGQDPEVKAIHAGLECGLFYEKFPGIDMISFGPTIKGAHTPEERIEIASTTKFWDLLLDVLKNIPAV